MLKAGELLRGALVHRSARAPVTPAVSVVLPTWARARCGSLERAVRSVLTQGFADLELIALDDGSTDGSFELLLDWQRSDPRLVVVRDELHSGLPALRVNHGIELARAPLVAFQFDDDEWLPDALAALAAVHQAADAPVVAFGDAELIYPTGERETLPAGVPVNVLTISFSNRVANAAVLVPRVLLDRYGLYDPHVAMRRTSDWDLWYRLVRHVPFVHAGAVVARIRVAADARSLGRAVPFDLPLFRLLQSIPRSRLLRPQRWRDYEVDATDIGGVPITGGFAARLERQLAPFRASLRHAFPHLAPAAPRARMEIGNVLVTKDSFYPSLEMTMGHYDEVSSARAVAKMHYQPLVQVEPDWPDDVEQVLLVRTTLDASLGLLARARSAGVPVGYYTDDDLLHLHEYGPQWPRLAPGSPFRAVVEQQLAEADAVWVTSPGIEDMTLPYNRRIVPHNGAIREEWLPAALRPRAEGGVLRIGYTGAPYRIEEFGFLWEGLQRFSREMGPRASFEFWGADPSALPPLDSPTTHRPFTHSYPEFIDRLRRSRFDVQIAPLLEEPRPRKAKAPGRFYYAAMGGSLPILSDAYPYLQIAGGVSCLKVAGCDAAGWYAALMEAATMPAERFDGIRRAAIEHVRLAFTERAEIHLHEAALFATEVHARTRGARGEDGRPRVLLVFAADASARDRLGLLRTVPLLRRYGMAPRALCAGDAIELQRELAAARVPCQCVPAALLLGDATVDATGTLDTVLGWERPALVQASGPLPTVGAACRAAGVPLVERRPPRGVSKAVFATGLERVLHGIAETAPVTAAADLASSVVVMVGELAPEGRQLAAIDALAALGAEAPRLRLWGSDGGSGYALQCARRAFALGLGHRVELLRPDVAEAMLEDADVLLDLSSGNDLPEGVAVATAAAVDVLSSAPGAFADALVDGVTARRLDAVDATSIAGALRDVMALGRRRRQELGAAAHRWARAELHPTRTASETWRLYVSALRSHGAAASVARDDAGATPEATVQGPRWRPAGARARARELAKRTNLYRSLSRLYWAPRRKRVLVAHDDAGVSLELYFGRALPALQAATGREWLVRPAASIDPGELHTFSTVILARATSARSLELLRAARAAGLRTLYHADDHLLLVEQAIPDPRHPWRRAFDAAGPAIEAMLRESHAVLVNGSAALPHFRPYNPSLVVVGGFQSEALAQPPPASGSPPLTVGFLGSAHKDAELAPAIAAVRRLLAERRPLRFEIMGFLPAALADEPRVSLVPFQVPYDRFRSTLARLEWDVGLAPLRPLPFHDCKSDIKYREYGSAWIAGVYSDVPVYRAAVRDRATGLLVEHGSEESWYEAIRSLVEDPVLRDAIRRNAHADVQAKYSVDHYATRMASAVQGELPRERAPAARS